MKLFHDKAPTLRVSVELMPDNDDLMTVSVESILREAPPADGQKALRTLGRRAAVREFRDFYAKHDGFELFRTFHAGHGEVRPIIDFKPAAGIESFTNRHKPGGDRAWTMDLNKSRELYRGSDSWIAFAEIDSGPCCLTMFVSGEHAGKVFYSAPQPEFNILRPISPGFTALLEQIAQDPAGFLRLIRGWVVLRGRDRANYALRAFEYVPRKRTVSPKPKSRAKRPG
jgi:hypothetical protein